MQYKMVNYILYIFAASLSCTFVNGEILPQEERRNLLIGYFTKRIQHPHKMTDFSDNKLLINREARDIVDKRKPFTPVRHWQNTQLRQMSYQQKTTTEQLKNELETLKRRQRWIPPSRPTYALHSGPLRYGSTQLYSVARKVQQLGSTTRQNSRSVNGIIRWKTSAQQRIEQLERLIDSSSGNLPERSFHHNSASLVGQANSLDGNTQQIQAIQAHISQLQQTIQNLQSQSHTSRGRTQPNIRTEFERAFSNSPSATSQQDSINENTRQIQAILRSLQNLQTTVENLQLSRNTQVSPNTDSSTNTLAAQRRITSSSNSRNKPQVSDDVASTLQDHENRLVSHDTLLRKKRIDITSLQHQLFRLIRKGIERDSKIRQLENDRNDAANTSPMQAEILFTTSRGSLTLNETMEWQNNRIKALEQQAQEAKSCCLRINSISRRFDEMSDSVNEARTRAEENGVAVRIQKRKIDEVINRMNTQRIFIKRLQDSLINQQRSASRLNRNLQDIVHYQTQEINRTLSAAIMRHFQTLNNRFDSDILELHAQVIENKNNISRTASFFESSRQQKTIDITDIKHRLYKEFPHFMSDTTRNISSIIGRLNSNNQAILGMMTLVGEIQEQEASRQRAIGDRVNSNRKSIADLQSSLGEAETNLRNYFDARNDFLEQTMRFLNISFHHVRASMQRQTRRRAELSSHVERLNLSERKTKHKLAHLRELFDEHVAQSSNASLALRFMVTSDANSLRHTVGLRLGALSKTLKLINASASQLATQQLLMTDTIADASASNARSLERLERTTNELAGNQESLSNHYRGFRFSVNSKIALLNSSIPKMLKTRFKDIEYLADVFIDQVADMNIRLDSLTKNSSRHEEHISVIRRYLSRANRNFNSLRYLTAKLGDRTDVLEEYSDIHNISLREIELRIKSVSENMLNYGDVTNTNRHELKKIKQTAKEQNTALNRIVGMNQQRLEDLKRQFNISNRKQNRDVIVINNRLDRLNAKMAKSNSDFAENVEAYNERLMSLETLNATLRVEINECLNEIKTTQGSIDQLHNTDTTLFESINLHDRALVEHRKLHHNLTALSDGVRDVINEHGEALDTVRDVVTQLNETLKGEKEQIDEAVTSQVQRQIREVKKLRFVMRNFTSLLQTLLSDRLNQEISLASVRMRQRSVLETIDGISASVDRLNHDTSRIKVSLNEGDVSREEINRQLHSALAHLTNHEHRIRILDSTTFRLVDTASSLNSSLITQSEEVHEIERFLESNRDFIYDLAELQATLQENLSKQKATVEETVSSILDQLSVFFVTSRQQNQSIEALQSLSANSTKSLLQFDTNMKLLNTRIDLIAEAMSSLAFVDNNITQLSQSVETLTGISQKNSKHYKDLHSSLLIYQDEVSLINNESERRKLELQQYFTYLNNSIKTYDHFRNQADKLTRDLTRRMNRVESDVIFISNTTSVVTKKLQTSFSNQKALLLKMVGNIEDQAEDISSLQTKVSQHEAAVYWLNTTSLRVHRAMEQLRAKDRAHSSSIKELSQTAREQEDVLQNLQTFYWNSKSVITELTTRTSQVEDEVRFLEAKLSGSRDRTHTSLGNIQIRLKQLESNLTEVKNRILLLDVDQNNLNNVTSLLSHTVQEQSSQLSYLNDSLTFGAFDVFSSLSSAILAMEESINHVNTSLSTEVTGITSLLVDFQLAFDTAGRQMEQHNHELNILSANSTNYFDYFLSTIDYLRQIVHQTNEAVGENRERVQLLNSSILFFQLEFSPSNITDIKEAAEEIQINDEVENSPVSRNQPEHIRLRSNQQVIEEDYNGKDGESNNQEYHYAQAKANTKKYLTISAPNYKDYPIETEYDLAALLDGDADQIRIERRLSELMDPDYTESYNDEYQYYDSDEE